MWKGLRFTQNIDTIEKITSRWVYGIEQMLSHEGRIHIVRYEDLVSDPRRVLTGVGEWLGVDPAAFPTLDARPTSIGKHRDGLSDAELTVVNRIAGPTLERLGYR